MQRAVRKYILPVTQQFCSYTWQWIFTCFKKACDLFRKEVPSLSFMKYLGYFMRIEMKARVRSEHSINFVTY